MVLTTPVSAATTINLDGTGSGRTFDGIGAISGGGGNSRLLIDYPEPQRSQILDYLFKPGYGAALQLLKVEVGGDTNSTSGAEPSHKHTATDLSCERGYEWWLMKEAKTRNPDIKLAALAWGAPGWVGNGSFWSTDMINYYISWLDCARDVHGLTIDYVGGWNEKGHSTSWFRSFRSELTARGYGNIQVIADDTSWNVATSVLSDPLFGQSVDVLGSHYVCGYRSSQTTCASSSTALTTGKQLWASENGSDDYNAGAAALARGINRGYIDGKMTAYINWPLIAALYPNLPFPTMGLALAQQPWSGNFSVGKNLWAIAHTTQFTAPGWRYLDSGSGYLGGNRAKGSYVTLQSPNGSDFSMIIETMDATAAEALTVNLSEGLSTAPVHVWSSDVQSTNSTELLVEGAELLPVEGSFTLTLQPRRLYTLTTTTGQGRGTASGPARASLPLPYSDNFDAYEVGRPAKYLADMQGAFEVTSCAAGRPGGCLRQMSPRVPITWTQLAEPYALIGDVDWSNYKVSIDVLLEQAGQVSLLGRVGTQRTFDARGLNEYYLRVANTGAWSLIRNDVNRSNVVLRSGTVASLGINQWHNLALTFSGATITAQIDGVTVATVSDATWSKGQVGIGTSQATLAQFDNLSVTAASSGGSGSGTVDTGRLLNVGSGRCLGVASSSNGAAVVISNCTAAVGQQWTRQTDGSIRAYGKCLDVPRQSKTAGTALNLWDCNGGANQRWTWTSSRTLVGVQSGLCLEARSTSNSAVVQIASCNSGTRQQWTR